MNVHVSATKSASEATRTPTPITVAHGDGIGPEIMKASLKVLEAAGAALKPEPIEIGEQVYLKGVSAGIEDSAWESLRRTKVFYKAPITTPQGGGFKSLNVTVRKSLGLFANVRPCAALSPFVATRHPDMDVVIVRENEEDLYAGIEHRQTDEVVQCLKLISRPGCERIVRYAFDYARANGRKKVTCLSKDNIMKLTDGLFHEVFDEIAKDYPDIKTDHWIIDIGTAKLADAPEQFDVIVTSNLYGDIISDVAAEITGSVGLGGSANIGEHCAMFEAIHGSAPDIAGQNIANPSGLLHGAIMMLSHLGLPDYASTIHNAWLKTIEDGMHTGDIANEMTKQKLGTKEFAEAVIERLGEEPETYRPVKYKKTSGNTEIRAVMAEQTEERKLIGADLFVHWYGQDVQALSEKLLAISDERMSLNLISCKGLKMWPDVQNEMDVTDRYRARFLPESEDTVLTHQDVADLLNRAAEAGVDFIKVETLFTFDGKPGFSATQGG